MNMKLKLKLNDRIKLVERRMATPSGNTEKTNTYYIN